MVDINLLDIDENEVVNYINSELLKGRNMKDIELNDFEVNDRVIVKRLVRRGYKRFENNLNIRDEKGKLIKVFNKDDSLKATNEENKEDKYKVTDNRKTIIGHNEDEQYDKGSSIVIHNGDIKIKEDNLKVQDIIELIDKKEEIFKMLDAFKKMSYNMGDNMSDNMETDATSITIRLPNPRNNQFKATIRLNDVVWEQFKEFANKYPFFTTKDLVSQALVDFMNKYNK